jgi:hypothetical protein
VKTKATRLVFLTLSLWFGPQVSHAERGEPLGDEVIVYVQLNNVAVPELRRAQLITARIFARIGVEVKFSTRVKRKSTRDLPANIVLQVDESAPAQLHSGAMAYAMPFGTSGTRIHVFLDRVRNVWPQDGEGILMRYVMAHEITHVLQGANRHSENGIMKANWERQDYAQMKSGTLLFDTTDSDLILTALRQVRNERGANK